MNEQQGDRRPVQGELVDEEQPKSPASTLMMLVVGALAALYLINPSAGILELLPDNLPIIGNLDEVAATTILLASLAHFGVELPWLKKNSQRKS